MCVHDNWLVPNLVTYIACSTYKHNGLLTSLQSMCVSIRLENKLACNLPATLTVCCVNGCVKSIKYQRDYVACICICTAIPGSDRVYSMHAWRAMAHAAGLLFDAIGGWGHPHTHIPIGYPVVCMYSRLSVAIVRACMPLACASARRETPSKGRGGEWKTGGRLWT